MTKAVQEIYRKAEKLASRLRLLLYESLEIVAGDRRSSTRSIELDEPDRRI